MNKKELDFVLSEGEGLKIEFKEFFDKSFAKEIVAFANSSGGRIFLGINDKREAVQLEFSMTLRVNPEIINILVKTLNILSEGNN